MTSHASSKRFFGCCAAMLLGIVGAAHAEQYAPNYPTVVPYPYYTPSNPTFLPYGISLVATGGAVTLTFVGNGGALFTDYLYLASPASAYDSPNRPIFINQFSKAGSIVNLGTFPRGTVLTFALYADGSVMQYPDYTYFSGPGSLNPDGLAHAYVVTNYEGNPFATYVGFEDYSDFNYTDCQFIMTGLTIADVDHYVAASKGQVYSQTGAGAPELEATGFTFQASVVGNGATAVLGASDQLPSTVIENLSTNTSPGVWTFAQEFTSKAALDAADSSGTDTMTISTVDEGTLTGALNLPADDYPNAPDITNIVAAQTIYPYSLFTLNWLPFTEGTSNDLITLSLIAADGTGFTTPGLFNYGHLNGTATSYSFNANYTLHPGTVYQGTLTFEKITTLDTNSVPGAVGMTSYTSQTKFTAATTGTPPCEYRIDHNSAGFPAAGGSDSIDVATSNGCPWSVYNENSAITITSGSSGTGDGVVMYTVAPNTNATGQAWTFSIGGQTVTIVQAAPPSTCNVAPATTSASFSAAGGSNTVAVIATGGACTWAAFSNDAFLQITAGASGLSNGVVSYSVAVNPNNTARNGTLTIAGHIFTVMQAGSTCSVSPVTTSTNFVAAGGSGIVTVTANASNCTWLAASNDGFITITSGSSGSGNGTVGYTVAANPDNTSRSGTLTIAGDTFTVLQGAFACSVSPATTSANYAAAGGSGTVTVLANATNCAWTATSNDPDFITITAGSSGSGNGTVGYTVAANTNLTGRTGALTVAGQTFTVTQAAAENCGFTLSPANVNLSSKGGSKTVSVKTKVADCTWTAVSNDPFITIISGSSGTGNGKVAFTVAGNTNAAALTGSLTIAGETVVVKQAVGGCSFKLSPKSGKLKSTGGQATVKVTPNLSDCEWTAVSNDPFITITAGASGTGAGVVSYSVPANTNQTEQIGSITIAGQTYPVTEAGVK